MTKTYTYTLPTLTELAPALWTYIDAYQIVFLKGEMGAGKTTLVSALCKVKKVYDRVCSPTYSLMNEYKYEQEKGRIGSIYHFDLYRLSGEEDVLGIGFLDVIHSGSVCFVEWGERAGTLIKGFPIVVFELSLTAHTNQRLLSVQPLP